MRGQGDADATTVADFDADVDAALAWLAGTRGQPLGAAGHCTGGHLAFRAALPPEVRATACWYATGLHDGKLGKDPDAGSLARAGEIGGELLTVWGTRDPHTPAAARETISRGSTLATRLTWREYEAEHAFGRDVGDRYDPAVTDEAFARDDHAVPPGALSGEELFSRPVPRGGLRVRRAARRRARGRPRPSAPGRRSASARAVARVAGGAAGGAERERPRWWARRLVVLRAELPHGVGELAHGGGSSSGAVWARARGAGRSG